MKSLLSVILSPECFIRELWRPLGSRAPAKNPPDPKFANQASFAVRVADGFFGSFGWLRLPRSLRMTLGFVFSFIPHLSSFIL